MDADKIPSTVVRCKLSAIADGDPENFYMIWRVGARKPPKVVHAGEVAAAREANRLASAAPGKKFIVMRSVGFVQEPMS